jgi:hypothetical protein
VYYAGENHSAFQVKNIVVNVTMIYSQP